MINGLGSLRQGVLTVFLVVENLCSPFLAFREGFLEHRHRGRGSKRSMKELAGARPLHDIGSGESRQTTEAFIHENGAAIADRIPDHKAPI